MYKGATVAVVVPAYNEEGYVGSVIDGLPPFVDRAYVVDDGSTDDTWAEIKHHSQRRNDAHNGHFEDLIVPIQHERNRGVGGAIKTGYQHAREEGIEVTAVLGGDDQMNPRVLTKYLDPIVDDVADYAKGNRFARAEQWAEMPRFRLLGNVILSYLTKIASGYWETMDSQNGYTAISLRALEETDIEGMYEYYGYCNDLLVRLNAADMRVADVPRSSEYAYQEGWKSHIDYTEYIPRVSAMLAQSFLWRLRRKYLLTSYNPVAPLYVLGATITSVSVFGLLNSLRQRDGGGGSWTLSTTTGVLTMFAAAMLDRAENSHLESQIEDAATGESPSTERRLPQPADGDPVADPTASATREDGTAATDGDAAAADDANRAENGTLPAEEI